ncbi:Calx-beta domain-containing protein [Gimesia algae]|uniref:Calx-beta domain-containing protein n=1 Tax=Gimesia algae TaxID=2527971 RepID=UPI0036F2BF69
MTFDSGEQSKTIAVSLVNTELVELDETFLINLYNIQANQADILLADDQAVVTIRDEDQAQISVEDISVNENAGTAVITVSLNAPVDAPISVDYSTSDQTANNPADYHSASGTLIFNPGILSQTITVSIVDSDYFEVNETFQVDLSNVQDLDRNVTLSDDQAVVTIQDKEIGAADIHFRVVNQPTSTSLTGEADSIPVNQSIISEWSMYWVEIWVELTSRIEQGIFSAQVDLSYNSEFTSAAEIELGAGFTQNQAGIINDPNGTVTGITAESTSADLGTDRPLLFARIRFAPGSEDQVFLDTESQIIGPYDLNFELSNAQVSLTGNTPVTVNAGLSPGASIYANPFDLNDDDVINYRDLIRFVGLFNTVPSQSDSDEAWFADFNQDDRINYRDLIALIGNYGKSKPAPSPVNYSQNYPDAWNHLLLANTLITAPVTADSVSQPNVVSTFDSAVSLTSPALSSEQQETLKHIDIQVLDLGGDILGRAAGSTIYIDVNAAGYGWFVDSTPADYSEYYWSSELTLIALPDSDAADGIDLWTVIQHELGHLLDYEHSETGLMQETLAPGIRKLPEWELNYEYEDAIDPETIDPYFSTIQDGNNLLPF